MTISIDFFSTHLLVQPKINLQSIIEPNYCSWWWIAVNKTRMSELPQVLTTLCTNYHFILFLKISLFILCGWVLSASTPECQKRALDPTIDVCEPRYAGIELRASVRSISVLNHWAISPAPENFHFEYISKQVLESLSPGETECSLYRVTISDNLWKTDIIWATST